MKPLLNALSIFVLLMNFICFIFVAQDDGTDIVSKVILCTLYGLIILFWSNIIYRINKPNDHR